jgi:hypothetical protein
LILVYNKNKINKFPISLSKNDEISILKNSLVPRRRRNTTTLGFHGITMGTHTSMVGVQAWVASSFFLSFFLGFLPLLLVLCKRLPSTSVRTTSDS